MSFWRMEADAVVAVKRSQRCCAQLVALLALRVSMPSMASTARPWRCEPSRMEMLMDSDSGFCASRPAITTMGTVSSGTMARGPATMYMTKMNSSTKGRSTKASRLALVMKSRTDSKSRRLLA